MWAIHAAESQTRLQGWISDSSKAKIYQLAYQEQLCLEESRLSCTTTQMLLLSLIALLTSLSLLAFVGLTHRHYYLQWAAHEPPAYKAGLMT